MTSINEDNDFINDFIKWYIDSEITRSAANFTNRIIALLKRIESLLPKDIWTHLPKNNSLDSKVINIFNGGQ